MSWDGDRIVGASAAALGLGTVVLAAGLREGTATGGPGSRFLPILLGVLMMLLGGVIALGRARTPDDSPGTAETTGSGLARPLAMVGAMGCYALLFERLGFLVATAPVLAFLLAVYGERRWSVVLALSVFATIATYVVFGLGLKVPLPLGALERWAY
ncbi:MAG TPA: tripartite tricarboxylate transporter TctB family protein [Methylomirabilota bacterium]|nr:tripartite tricarboxylate transporter TctB family protein [Methylomirabilota bacterium]